MYYPERMMARSQVSPVQSIEPHRILAPTRDSNQEPPGLESRVVTTILPLPVRPGKRQSAGLDNVAIVRVTGAYWMNGVQSCIWTALLSGCPHNTAVPRIAHLLH